MGNIIAYTPNRGINREKYFNHIITEGENADFAGNSVHLFLHGPRLFHLSTEKVRVQSVRIGHQSDYSRAVTLNNYRNKNLRSVPKKEINKNASGKNLAYIK